MKSIEARERRESAGIKETPRYRVGDILIFLIALCSAHDIGSKLIIITYTSY